MKENISIVTENIADLSSEILKEHQIETVSCQLSWPESESLLGANIYQKMREADSLGIKTLPKTSQPSPKAYLNAFKKQLQKSNKVLCITISSKLSGSYNSAKQAKNFLGPDGENRVFIIDSLNVTAGQSLLILRAIELVRERKEISEVIAGIKDSIPNIHFHAFAKDPKWLEAGGRISPQMTSWMKRFQKIHLYPFVGIKDDGVIKAMGVARGKNIPEALFRQIKGKSKEAIKQGKKIRLVITHCDNLEAAEKLKKNLEEKMNTEITFVNLVNPIVGAHLGPGSLTAAWMAI